MDGSPLEPDLVGGALAVGARHLRHREFFAAHRAFRRASRLAAEDREERELALGLAHLAAAGHKRLLGDERGAGRQLTHARRRLAPFLPAARGLALDALVEGVEREGPR